MKRKAAESLSEDDEIEVLEVKQGGQTIQPSDKRRRCDHGDGSEEEGKENEKRRRSCKQWSCDVQKKDVTVELLEDMGVNILEESSRESLPAPKSNTEINLILQQQDQNSRSKGAVASAVRPGAGGAGDSTRDMTEDAGLAEADDSFSSNASFECSLSYNPPARAETLSHHAYAIPVDQSVPDEFFKYNRKPSPNKRRDVFNTMSDEVVLHVFRWLPKCTLAKCALVCKRWRRLSLDDSLWKRLDLGLKTLPAGVVGQVLGRGCQFLRLARSTMASDIFISPLNSTPTFSVDRRSKLQYLDLSMASIAVPCLESLMATCRQLKKLALENCELSDRACEGISQNSHLDTLHLAMTQGLTSAGITTILAGCPGLLELNVGWTGLSEEGVVAVCENLQPQLERLNLSGNRDTLRDEHVGLIVDNCPNLRELDLSDATKITSISLDLVVENLKSIESLSTSRCYGISPSSYLILSSCPSLLYLNVFGLLRDPAMVELRARLQGIEINKFLFTSIARPTVGIKRTSIWNFRVRE